MSDAPGTAPTPPDAAARPGLLLRVRGHLSLTRVQAVFGIIAALLSIGGALYGYLRPGRPSDIGDLVAIDQEGAQIHQPLRRFVWERVAAERTAHPEFSGRDEDHVLRQRLGFGAVKGLLRPEDQIGDEEHQPDGDHDGLRSRQALATSSRYLVHSARA